MCASCSYVALALEAARVAAPGVKLFYNDYGWGVGSKFDVICERKLGADTCSVLTVLRWLASAQITCSRTSRRVSPRYRSMASGCRCTAT